MIEVPRAALTAGQIAEHADFFSFGTNDLTQVTWGFSRDDVEGAFFSKLGSFGPDDDGGGAASWEVESRLAPLSSRPAISRNHDPCRRRGQR